MKAYNSTVTEIATWYIEVEQRKYQKDRKGKQQPAKSEQTVAENTLKTLLQTINTGRGLEAQSQTSTTTANPAMGFPGTNVPNANLNPVNRPMNMLPKKS